MMSANWFRPRALPKAFPIPTGWSKPRARKDQARGFILTLYERRIDYADLPYFLDLLDHLAAKGCPVPRTIHDRTDASFRMVEGKAAALIEFLPGVSPTRPTAAQAHSVGAVLARMHLAARDFFPDPRQRDGFCRERGDFSINAGLSVWPRSTPICRRCSSTRTAPPRLIFPALPASQTHTDLFPDNVLMRGDVVTGLIDFYFACTGPMALDLAVTHAAWVFR